MSSLFLMITITDRRSTDGFLQLYKSHGVTVSMRTVASGPMTATFLLPLAQGACVAVGGNIVTDAFGVVAMVAMTPLITVQMMGLVAQLRTRKARTAQPAAVLATVFADLPDDAIIEL